jgi:glutamine amidotransferase
MCQLLGLNANTPTDLVFSFTGFAHRAAEHKDGFGIAFFEGAGLRLFVDHLSATESPVAAMIRHYPIRSRHIVTHIRKATQGRVALENTHPFVRELWGRYWVFAHNGNLVDYHPKLHASFHPVGDTDSERAFCWLMQELAKNHARMPSIPDLTQTLAELAPQIARHGTFNFLLSQGEALWAHCSTKLHYVLRRHPFPAAQLQDADLTVDFAEHTTPQDRVAVIVTEPLTCNEDWVALAPGELAVFVDGDRR